MTTLRAVVEHLHRRGVRCALIGAGALALHGVSRATADTDLLTSDAQTLEPAFWTGLAQHGLTLEVRRGDDSDPLAGVVRITGSEALPVDLVVAKPTWQADVIARSMPARYLDADLSAVTAADLVLLKLYAGGAQDRSDVRLLLETMPALRAQVEASMPAMPPDLRARWTNWRDPER